MDEAEKTEGEVVAEPTETETVETEKVEEGAPEGEVASEGNGEGV